MKVSELRTGMIIEVRVDGTTNFGVVFIGTPWGILIHADKQMKGSGLSPCISTRQGVQHVLKQDTQLAVETLIDNIHKIYSVRRIADVFDSAFLPASEYKGDNTNLVENTLRRRKQLQRDYTVVYSPTITIQYGDCKDITLTKEELDSLIDSLQDMDVI